MSHIFISYSKKNRDYARALADKLLDAGFDVWIDDRIDYGDDWWQVIVKAIRECAAFVVIMTPESDASKWVQREVTLADHLPKPIFPVLREGDLLNSDNWSMFLRTQYADVRDGNFPKADFYIRLRRVVTPKSTRGSEVKERTFPLIIKPDWVGKIIPEPFEWCLVPAGRAVLEPSKDVSGYLKEKSTLEVPQFHISKYPITNAQFRAFVTAIDGWRDAGWWSYSEPATQHRIRRLERKPATLDDAPCTQVTWYSMVAFTCWLSAKTGENLTMPSEQHWERAVDASSSLSYNDSKAVSELGKTDSYNSKGKYKSPVTHSSYFTNHYKMIVIDGLNEVTLTDWVTGKTDLGGIESRVVRGLFRLPLFNGRPPIIAGLRGNSAPNHTMVGFRIARL